MQEFEQPLYVNEPRPLFLQREFEEPLFNTINQDFEEPLIPDETTVVPNETLDNIFKEYGRKLTKEDIVNDERLMDVVRTSLEARFTPGGVLTKARRAATGLAGGTIGGLSRDYRGMSNEDAFEAWQNYQRSFSGGQTVTVANELAYGMGANKKIQSDLGAGYLLFDGMTNAFTGEGSWSEMGDAIYDYGKSAIFDPSTILSLGLGKLIGFGATKTSSAAARALMIKAYQNQVKAGVTKATALKSVGQAVKKSLPFATADALIGAGVDVAYQAQLINVDAKEEYSGAETALAAAGSLVIIPTLAAAGASIKEFRNSALKDTFLAYKKIDDDLVNLTPQEAKRKLDARVNKNTLIDSVDDNFGIIKGDSKEFLNWEDIRTESELGVEFRGEEIIDFELLDSFYKRFFFGDEEAGKKGYYQALKEAGFVVHESMLEQVRKDPKTNRVRTLGITGVFGQTIEYLSDDVVEKAMKNFEKSTGQKLGIEYTAKALSENFIVRASRAGSMLWTPSQLSRFEKMNIKPDDAAAILGGKRLKPKDLPARTQFTMSLYKRLLTSHLSTTGANIKGFAQLVSLNTVADMFTAAVNLGQGAGYKLTGNLDQAEKYFNRSYGSALGAIRRGFDVFSPDMPIEYADKIFSLNKEVEAKIFRDVSGDGGVRDGIKDFNLDQIKYKGVFEGLDDVEIKAWKTANAVTKGAQTLTGVRIQDDLTKRWSFGTNLNQAIMRAYGETPEKFFARKDVALEMASDKFQEEVLDKAVFRTLRETASVNWSSLPGREGLLAARSWARGIEIFTNRTPVGFIVPFGSFLNTTIATMSDYTGLNAFRFGIRKLTGKELDFATREGAEALGKMAAGYTAIGLGVISARDRIANNLAPNQEEQSDGSVRNLQYDWPSSTMRVMSQIAAHGLGDSNNILDFKFKEVPDGLFAELGVQIGAQSVRDLDEAGQAIYYAASEMVYEQNFQPFLDMLSGSFGRIAQGATRPLDPINQVFGLVSGADMNIDLRQGSKNQNQAFRYINNIIGGQKDLPKRAEPTRGTEFTPDVSKQVLGARTIPVPNLVEQMMNAAGRPYWKAIKFDGPPEIKNTMDNIAAPFFETEAIKLLQDNPDYFNKTFTLKEREKILDVMAERVREDVINIVEKGMPKTFDLVRVLSGENKKKVKEIMEFLSIEGELVDLLDAEDGLQDLLRIKSLLDSYDDINFNNLDID